MDGHRVQAVILPGNRSLKNARHGSRRNRNGRINPRLGIDSKLQYEAWVQAAHVLTSSLPMSINIMYVYRYTNGNRVPSSREFFPMFD